MLNRKSIKLFLFVVWLLSLIACSRKSAPTSTTTIPAQVTPVVIKTDCDSIVAELLAEFANSDLSASYEEALVRSISALNESQRQLAECQAELEMKPATVTVQKDCPPQKVKIKNSFNEETKLRNSLQIKDAQIESLQLDNVSLKSKLKESNDSITKILAKKGGVIGDGNTVDNSNKQLAWWWIFLAGMLTWALLQNVGFRFLKRYFPFLNFLP